MGERYSRVTTLMSGFVIKLLQACPTTQSVCNLTRLSWSTVNAIMVRAVELGMLKRTEEKSPIWESMRRAPQKGHSYVTILTDIDRSRVLDLIPEKAGGRQNAAQALTPAQRASVKAVAMDIWPAFMGAAAQCCLRLTSLHDKFHVSKVPRGSGGYGTQTRAPSTLSVGKLPLTGNKWAWLKSYPMVAAQRPCRFGPNQLNLKTSRGVDHQNFTQFWSYSYKGSAKAILLMPGPPARCAVDWTSQKGGQDAAPSQDRSAQLQSTQNQQCMC